MITCYTATPMGLEKHLVNHAQALDPAAVWVDLLNPTQQERQWIETLYGHEPLFPEEMSEIEASARYYQDEAGLHAHIYFLNQESNGKYRNSSIVFTLQKTRLLSLRLDDFKELHGAYLQFQTQPSPAPLDILLALISLRLDNLADMFERLHLELETLSHAIFAQEGHGMERILNTLARLEDINAKARLGMMDNQRIYSALQQRLQFSTLQQQALHTILSDTESLLTHSNYLFEKIKFLMDSAMGMMNIAQNKRLNIFTVLSVVLMPPTVIASIYGMNFEHIPELKWLWGYPMALLLMLFVAVVPIIYLRRKGWL